MATAPKLDTLMKTKDSKKKEPGTGKTKKPFHAGKVYADGKSILWRRRRKLGMDLVGITPTSIHVVKIGKMKSAGCWLRRRARKASVYSKG